MDMMKFVPEVLINNITALIQIIAWCQPGNKPLSEPMILIYWYIYASLGFNNLTNFLRNEADTYISKPVAAANTQCLPVM